MDDKAQVSIEYLITALFGIMLAMAAAVMIEALRGIALDARAKVLTYREQTISSLIS